MNPNRFWYGLGRAHLISATHWILTSVLTLSYASTTSAAATYRYSGDGLRTTVATQASGTTSYAYDPSGSGGLGQPTGTFTSGTLTSQTLYGPGTDDPLVQTTSSGTYFLLADGGGSVTSVTSATQLQSSYRYDPYSVSTEAAGPVSSPYRYAGGVWDAGPGLAYDRARFYDPSTGRFLSQDPVGGGYAYAGDNPVNARDPSGRSSWTGAGEGGGTSTPSCSLGQLLNGDCPSETGSTTSSGGNPGGGGNGPVVSPRCAVDWTLLVVGLVMGMLGIWADLQDATMMAHILDIATLMGPDFEGLSAAFASGNIGGEISAIAGALFDALQAIWGEIIENIVTGFFMWLSVALNFAETFVRLARTSLRARKQYGVCVCLSPS